MVIRHDYCRYCDSRWSGSVRFFAVEKEQIPERCSYRITGVGFEITDAECSLWSALNRLPRRTKNVQVNYWRTDLSVGA